MLGMVLVAAVMFLEPDPALYPVQVPSSVPCSSNFPVCCVLLQAECSRSISTVHAVLRSWRASSPAHAARALGSSADGLLDLAPALRDISRPAAVRAVNAQLLSRAEERVLTHVVSSSLRTVLYQRSKTCRTYCCCSQAGCCMVR